MTVTATRTWADGHGRWYAAVPATDDEAQLTAWSAIAAELAERERHFDTNALDVALVEVRATEHIYREVDEYDDN